MTTQRKIEVLVYTLVIVLCVVVIALVAVSSSLETDTRVIYQGF